MSSYEAQGSVLGRLVTWLIVGLIALVALKILFAVAGTAFKLATTLLFTLVPILLVGWLTMRAIRWLTRSD